MLVLMCTKLGMELDRSILDQAKIEFLELCGKIENVILTKEEVIAVSNAIDKFRGRVLKYLKILYDKDDEASVIEINRIQLLDVQLMKLRKKIKTKLSKLVPVIEKF
jgi:hypothetical protein